MRQLRVAVRDKTQCALYSARRYLKFDNESTALLKLDFRNAFNAVDRQQVLDATAKRVPELSTWVECSYGLPSVLFFDGREIEFSRGTHSSSFSSRLLFTASCAPCARLSARGTWTIA